MSQPIVIWGAGAIGGTLGAAFLRAGEEVIVVDTAKDHVDAINAGGLRIAGPIFEGSFQAKACMPSELEGQYERIYLCVKAHHTEAATQALVQHMPSDGYVVSAQNGLNEQVIARIAGDPRCQPVGRLLHGAGDCAMKKKLSGRIINISSGAGLGISLTGIQSYASAKAGQIGLTRQLAQELGPWNITVNNVAPGFVRSNPADAVYFNMNRFTAHRPYTPPPAVLDIFKRELDRAYKDGGLFLLTMHPHVTGYRSRIFILEELIRHIQNHDDVWFGTHADIARFVKDGG